MIRFSHIALNCGDLDKTEAFYQQLGFKRSRLIDLGEQKILFIKLGEVYLELFQAEGQSSKPAQGDGSHEQGLIRHLAFQVANVDAVVNSLKIPEILLGPLDFDAFIPGWRTYWLKDPDGNVVEISQGFTDDQSLS